MRFIVVLCVGLILYLPHTWVNANPAPTFPNLTHAELETLARHPQWLALLHFNQGGTLHKRNKSYVSSEHFFLSEAGKQNPRAELQKNIEYFFSDDAEKLQYRCQFPARFRWISEQLELAPYQQGLKHCDTFLAMHSKVAAKKITLIFPSAYMNSASSIFGHTLFRIDNSLEDESVILNWAVNYGAKLNPDDNAIEYALKGLGGAYKGQYFVVPYAQKIKEYGQMENRDIWEFPLALTQSEVDFLIEHLWELQNIEFDYYFFDENCAYRLLEILDVIKPELQLTRKFRFAEIPMNTVKTVQDSGLIENEVFRPSKERILKHQLAQLSKKEIQLVKQLADADVNLQSTLEHDDFKKHDVQKQLLITQTAYELLRFEQSQIERQAAMAKRSLELLGQINQLSQLTGTSKAVLYTSTTLPTEARVLQSHDSRRLAFTTGKQQEGDGFSEIQLRMAYHDFLDNNAGYLNGAHIEGPALALKHQDAETYVDSFSLMNVMSLNPVNHIRSDFSWRLALQGKRNALGQNTLSTQLKIGGGLAWQHGNWMHYQMLSPLIEHNPDFSHHFKAGIHYELGVALKAQRYNSFAGFEVEKLEQQPARLTGNLIQHIELQRNHALRLGVRYFEQENNVLFEESKIAYVSYLFYF